MKILKNPLIALLSTLTIMFLCRLFLFQIDFTQDKRYSLSKNTIDQIKKIKYPLRIDVFLSGDLPSKYLNFRNELDFILDRINCFEGKLHSC